MESIKVTMSKRGDRSMRTALLVLGMHRSGTSALAGVLAALGARAPKSLMPPTDDNPKGYWESTAIMDFNNAILASAGSRWDEWESLNKEWHRTAVGQAMFSGLPALLDQEFGNAPLFLVKDPRICRILPAWLHALSQAGAAIKIVVSFRNPIEVAKSLETRNGLTRLQALLIWLRYVLDAEHDSRGQDRVFVRYADLLADWRSQVACIGSVLDIQWPRMSGRAEAEIDDYLDSGLKHHAVDQKLPTGNAILSWVAEVHVAYCDLVDGHNTAAAQARLDEVRRDFDAASSAFSPLFHEVRKDLTRRLEARSDNVVRVSAEAKELQGQVGALTGELEARAKDVGRISAEANELRGQVAGLTRQLEARADDVGRVSAEANELRGQVAVLTRQLEARAEEVGRASAEAKELRKELDIRRAATLEIEQRQQSIQAELAVAKSELAASRARASEAIAEKGNLEANCKEQLAALNDRLGETIKSLGDSRAQAEALAKKRLSDIVALSRRVLELEGLVSTGKSSMSALKVELTTSREDRKRLEVGIEVARRNLEDQGRRVRGLIAEHSAQASVISSYRQTLDKIRASGPWTLPGELRELARSSVEVNDAERPAAEIEAMLRKSKLFDAQWYLAKYRDVRESKTDPVRHYLSHGAKEGRDPGPAFSTAGYLTNNPDVQAAGINPLVHYLLYGRGEGRSVATRVPAPRARG